ncbi:hypothetical protein [Streptomyces sp. NPDC058872]|uniref:hypothetical protein n=1 Tax=Streptomyces sp. NPDC058872 TaxID=3346661 RepID=UPI00368720D3
MSIEPNDTWQLRNGTAWVFTAGAHLLRPVVLVGDAGTGLAELARRADDDAYSLLSELRARDFDLVLVGLFADGTMTGHGATVQNAVTEANARRRGHALLTVGGTGWGALAARYALAGMEYMRVEHRTETFFSHNAAAPGVEDQVELRRTGGRPYVPRFLRLVDGGVDDGLHDEIADETVIGEAGPVGPLLSKENGSWLLEHLPY